MRQQIWAISLGVIDAEFVEAEHASGNRLPETTKLCEELEAET